MYGRLLAMAVADELADGEAPAEQDLVRHLSDLRGRLAPRSPLFGPVTVDAVETLAAHVDYDRTLLRLCRLRGIACAPERFSRPVAERQRLEAALMADGVVLVGTGHRR